MSDNLTAQNTVSLDTAVTWTTQWRDYYSSSAQNEVMYSEILRAFWIPIADIQNLANVHGADAVRAYLCLRDPNDITTIKVVLVPVIDNVDILTMPAAEFANDGGQVKDDGDSTIYDFTQPCPVQCDPGSPLYGLDGKGHH